MPVPAHPHARPASPRRAFSLVELTATLAVIGVLSAMAVTRFGHDALATVEAEGYARRVALDLRQARRRTIATGVDHYLQFNRAGGVVVSSVVCRDGGDPVDDTRPVPTGAIVTTGTDQLAFDFDGALQAAGGSSTITIDAAAFRWVITCYHATGSAACVKSPQP